MVLPLVPARRHHIGVRQVYFFAGTGAALNSFVHILLVSRIWGLFRTDPGFLNAGELILISDRGPGVS